MKSMQPICKTYLNTREACAFLGCGDEKITKLRMGIREEIENGRYSPYAISGNLIHAGVLIDYNKYRDYLKQKAFRDTVPAFNLIEATLHAVTAMAERGNNDQ